jgi:beta-lactamase regulating signal transducer with metallopeptidase domain/Flp pilus assembly protein TadD
MLAWYLENTLVAGVLALVVAAVVRLGRPRPALAHLLWLAALGVLLMPRLPWIATPGAELRTSIRAWLGASPAALEAPDPVLQAALDLPAVGSAEPQSAPMLLDASTQSASDRERRPAVWESLPFSLETAVLLVWIGGTVVVLARSTRRILPFQRLVRRSALAPLALRREVREVARRLGVREPEVRVVKGVASPSIWCLGRPRLLWPAEAATSASQRARCPLIAHELAHLARRDHWVSWLEIPAAALSWWNPLFWWIRGHIRHYAELSCDAWAVWAYPADRRAFAEALIVMQARTRTAPVALQGLGATDSECKDFERRLDMIMKKGKFPGVSRSAAVVAAVTAILASPGFTDGKKHCAAKSTECASGSPSVVESRARSAVLAKKAKELFDAKQHEAALATLQEIVVLDPENGWAHGRIGYIQIGARQLEAARQSFRRQYELGFERPNALYNTACAVAQAGDTQLALEYTAAAVANGFANADLMAEDADLASIRGDGRFQELLRKVRTASELREELARLEKEGKKDLFLATHAELAAILVADGKLQAEHGLMALASGDVEGATLAFGRQAEAGHDVPTAHYNRACARSRAGDGEGAMDDLRTAAERGMGYDGIAKDADLDGVRKLAGFADLEARILATARENRELKSLLASEKEADAPALTALLEDAKRSNKVRALAALSLGRLHLGSERFADAYATFERAAELGVEVRQSAFGMAQALAGVGKDSEALRHVELALDLGYADPAALQSLLEESALASPADAEAMVARATKARDASKKEYGEKGKAWAAGMKAKPKAYGEKVAQEY